MEPLVARPVVAQQSRWHYLVWFIFAPIPINSLAAAIDIKALTSQCCVILPDYLSRRSKFFIYSVALLTHVNVFTWLGLCVATALSYAIDLQHPQPMVSHFVYLLRLAHCIMIARTGVRWWVARDIRKRGLGLSGAAGVEYHTDLIMWSSFMIGGIVKGMIWLKKDDLWKEMAMGPLTTGQVDLVQTLVSAFINGWIADVILRFLWLCLSPGIEADFKSSLQYRLVAALPTIASMEQCSICLSEGAESEEGGEACEMPCSHCCHRACLVSWARACRQESSFSCPLCRERISFRIDDFGHTLVAPIS